MAEAVKPHKPDVLAGIESRGFLLAAPLALALGTGFVMLRKQGKLPGIDLSDITYYVGRETIIPSEDIPGMWVWREGLFAFLQRNAERSAAFFGVPTKQVVEFGTELEI